MRPNDLAEVLDRVAGEADVRSLYDSMVSTGEKGRRDGQVNDVPMDQWTPEELSARLQYMQDFATRLEASGEFVDSQALSPEGTFVRSDGEGRPPVTDGPFAETKDLIAGWMVIDVESYARAVELAGELSAAPGQDGKPIHEWLEVRPFMAEPPTITE